MKKNEEVSRIPETVYLMLTKGVTSFIRWSVYKTAEIKISNQKIGIGILDYDSNDHSVIKLFIIRDEYDKDDTRRFYPTFTIRFFKSNIKGAKICFNVELAKDSLTANEDNVAQIVHHSEAFNQVIKTITVVISCIKETTLKRRPYTVP